MKISNLTYILLTSFLTLFNSKTFSQQQNEDINATSKEIIQWINNFEDRNSPERIMQGTLQDKVNCEYVDGKLIINSMIWISSKEPSLSVRDIINIQDILKIEAAETDKGEYIIADIIICTKKGSIAMESKRYNELNFSKFILEDKWFDQKGFCSYNLRFKFQKDLAKQEVQRVYKALESLVKLHGANPKIGSLF